MATPAYQPNGNDLKILRFVAHGFRHGEIAARLGWNAHRVSMRMNLMRNRFAPTNEMLVALAITKGWVQLDLENEEMRPAQG